MGARGIPVLINDVAAVMAMSQGLVMIYLHTSAREIVSCTRAVAIALSPAIGPVRHKYRNCRRIVEHFSLSKQLLSNGTFGG